MADISPRLDAGHPESLPFPHLTGYWVSRLGGAFRKAVDRELREHDLTRRQVGTLMHVAHGLAETAADLTRATGVDSTAVTRMIDRLEEKDLLERRPDPEDGRRQVLHLTRAARGLMPRIERIAKHVEGRFEAGLDPRELATFHRVLMAMLENVGESHVALLEDE